MYFTLLSVCRSLCSRGALALSLSKHTVVQNDNSLDTSLLILRSPMCGVSDGHCFQCCTARLFITVSILLPASCLLHEFTRNRYMHPLTRMRTPAFETFASNSDCEICPKGKFQGLTEQVECFLCQPGEFTSGAGQVSCPLCAPGTFSNTSGTLLACVGEGMEVGGVRDADVCLSMSACICVYMYVYVHVCVYVWGYVCCVHLCL